MSYFRELPDLEIQSILSNKTSSHDYVLVKNLFRRNKLRDDIKNIVIAFDKYEIEEGERPDNVAEKVYGSSDLDWIVLITAGIIHVKNQWPLSNRDLYNFCLEKYGYNGLTEIRFYETIEVKDSNNRLLLPAGKVVDSNFTIPNISYSPVVGVTNYQYETRLNEEKRTIYILKNIYLSQFMVDFRKLMTYKKSSQFVNSKLIRTENTYSTNT